MDEKVKRGYWQNKWVVVTTSNYKKMNRGDVFFCTWADERHRYTYYSSGTPTHCALQLNGMNADSRFKSTNFRLATAEEIELAERGVKNVMSAIQAIENDSPAFVQEIKVTFDGANKVVEHVGNPMYFESYNAARAYVEAEIRKGQRDLLDKQFAMFRYTATAKALEAPIAYEKSL